MTFSERIRNVVGWIPTGSSPIRSSSCLACTRCSRKGSYRLARLAERYGAEIRMPELLSLLSGDCAFRGIKRFAGSHEQCGAIYPDLGTPPTPPDLPPSIARLKVVKSGRER